MNILTTKNIIEDLLKISTKYLGTDIDKNRISTNGFITESMAESIDAGTHLAILNTADNNIELTNDEIKIKATSKIRRIDDVAPKAAKIGVTLFIKKEDVIVNGIKDGMNYTFILDKRSKLIVNDIPFTLSNNIIIRAIYNAGKYIYTANYVDSKDNEVIIVYNAVMKDGSLRLALFLNMYQVVYRQEESVVIDIDQFTYEGMAFEHDKLAGFEVYYRTTSTDEYVLLNKYYYRFDNYEPNSILFNDDDSKLLFIYNNPNMPLHENGDIKVVFLETMGAEGTFDTTGADKVFTVYSDEYYKFAGFDIQADVLTDSKGGSDGDTITEIKTKLINKKLSRDIIVTDKDIKNATASKDDIIIIKKRSDLKFKLFNLYQIMRNGDEIVPTVTRNAIIKRSDFNLIHSSSLTKVVRANNVYSMMPGKEKTVVVKNGMTALEMAAAEIDVTKLGLICPFAYNISNDNILTYYLNFINRNIAVRATYTNEAYEYQFIMIGMNIERNPYVTTATHDMYTLRAQGILNTADNIGLVDANGNIIDTELIKIYAIFKDDIQKVSYIPMTVYKYDPITRVIYFSGTFKSNDYITASRKLQITGGMSRTQTFDNFEDVIDFTNMSIETVVTFNTLPASTADYNYSLLPIATRTISGKFDTDIDPFDLITECNKFTRSSVKVLEPSTPGLPLRYHINELPMIKYSYLLDNYNELYPVLLKLVDYIDIISKLVDNTINVKFTNTYGKSKFIFVGNNVPLNNLNPLLKFKAYGRNIDSAAIEARIKKEFASFKSNNIYIFISNINTIIETEFPNVESFEFIGVDAFDSSYQKFRNAIDMYDTII